MGTAKNKFGATLGASLMVAAASMTLGVAAANAEPTEEPAIEPTVEQTVEATPEPATEEAAEPTTEETTEPAAEPATEPGTEPAAANGNVRYTLATAAPYQFTITYLTTQPASKDAYNADADAYLKRDTVTVTPEAPWVFETDLADPQWAFLQASSTARGGMAAPNAHCDVAVDGVVAVQSDHPYSPVCLLSQW